MQQAKTTSDIPELTSLRPGDELVLEHLVSLYSQTGDTDRAVDVRDVDQARAHPLTGPVHVEGAEPGDLLVVDILDIQCMTSAGVSGVSSQEYSDNPDIKSLPVNSRIYFPVYVEGAGLTLGDLHFSQGDGKISFCGPIETDGTAHLCFDVIKGGMAKYNIAAPVYVPGIHDVRHAEWLSFTDF